MQDNCKTSSENRAIKTENESINLFDVLYVKCNQLVNYWDFL